MARRDPPPRAVVGVAMIEFTILGEPVPWGRVTPMLFYVGKQTRVRMVTPEKTRNAEASFAKAASLKRPRKPLDGALFVTTVFVITPPQRLDVDRSRDWPHVKPDDDNYRKLVLDALNGIFWHDDAQICGGQSFKIYGAPARTFVQIYPLGPADVARVREMLGEPASPQPSLFGG